MPTRTAHPCPRRGATEALAREELAGREQAEQHLTHCPACRTLFRQLTANRLPRIRNYTVLAQLGRGGFGIVYRALHHGKERTEALKVLFGKTAQREAYFENEVRLVAKLRHPNIATLFDAHLSTPPLYYTMEFVEGEHLDDYFRSHDVSLEERIELARTVAAAIGYAHRQGVIHRDLKPQNILVDSQGQPRIVDFGIAKRLGLEGEGDEPAPGSPPRPEGALGTYGYIAPEQLSGQKVDSRADIYGLGALLFHVITGQPARFATEVERLTEVLHDRHVSRADDLAAIIACCVNPSPEQRYPTCDAMVEDLDNYLAGRPIQARKDSHPGYRVARIGALVLRNHPLPVQAVVVLVVALLLISTFWSAGARWLSPGHSVDQTVLVAFTPSTLAALRCGQIGTDLPGLDPGNRKSWRLLYGQLMEKLADAQPSVVVWDYYFPDCQPEFDAGFARGVQALKAPVIVGSKHLDLNSEPVLCGEIRSAVHSWGALHSTNPERLKEAILVPLAVQRGLNPPVPSLALAGFAAARHPDCDVDIHLKPDRLNLRYRKRQVARGELRWPVTDEVPVFRTDVAGPAQPTLDPDDKTLLGCFRLQSISDWAEQAIPWEKVLTADPAQRRRWFASRPVLIGQMIPGIDEHELRSKRRAFGCQIQAMLLDSLLAGTRVPRFGRPGLVWRVCLWCVLAAVLVNLIPTRGTWPLRVVSPLAVTVVGLAVVLAARLAMQVITPWVTEVTIAGCVLLAGGAATLLVKLLHQRQLHLTPGPIWSADGTTASTTSLASAPMEPPA